MKGRLLLALKVGLSLTALLLVLTAIYSFYFRITYGTLDFRDHPERVDFNHARFFPYGRRDPVTELPGALKVVQDNPWPLPDVLIDSTQDPSYLFYLYVRTWDGRVWYLGAGGRA